MQLIKTGEGQTLIDIAMQESGKAELALAYAIANGMSLTERLEVDTQLRTLQVENRTVSEVLKQKRHLPASDADDIDQEPEQQEGIGYWTLNQYVVQ